LQPVTERADELWAAIANAAIPPSARTRLEKQYRGLDAFLKRLEEVVQAPDPRPLLEEIEGEEPITHMLHVRGFEAAFNLDSTEEKVRCLRVTIPPMWV
jgi:hypothetical protein